MLAGAELAGGGSRLHAASKAGQPSQGCTPRSECEPGADLLDALLKRQMYGRANRELLRDRIVVIA